MNQILSKKKFWRKSVSGFQRFMFGIIIFISYLSIILSTYGVIKIDQLYNSPYYANALTSLPLMYPDQSTILLDILQNLKYILIAFILFSLLWTILLSLTKSRILMTILLVLCASDLLFTFFSPQATFMEIFIKIISIFVVISAMIGCYTFHNKWNAYITVMSVHSVEKKAVKKVISSDEGYNPFLEPDEKEETVTSQNTNSLYAGGINPYTGEPIIPNKSNNQLSDTVPQSNIKNTEHVSSDIKDKSSSVMPEENLCITSERESAVTDSIVSENNESNIEIQHTETSNNASVTTTITDDTDIQNYYDEPLITGITDESVVQKDHAEFSLEFSESSDSQEPNQETFMKNSFDESAVQEYHAESSISDQSDSPVFEDFYQAPPIMETSDESATQEYHAESSISNQSDSPVFEDFYQASPIMETSDESATQEYHAESSISNQSDSPVFEDFYQAPPMMETSDKNEKKPSSIQPPIWNSDDVICVPAEPINFDDI